MSVTPGMREFGGIADKFQSIDSRLRKLELQRRIEASTTAVQRAGGTVDEETSIESSVTLTTTETDLTTVTLTVPDWVGTLSVVAFGFVRWGFVDLSTDDWNAALAKIRIDGTDSSAVQETKAVVGSHSTGDGFMRSTLFVSFARTISSPSTSIGVALRGFYDAAGSGGSILSAPVQLSVLALGSET